MSNQVIHFPISTITDLTSFNIEERRTKIKATAHEIPTVFACLYDQGDSKSFYDLVQVDYPLLNLPFGGPGQDQSQHTLAIHQTTDQLIKDFSQELQKTFGLVYTYDTAVSNLLAYAGYLEPHLKLSARNLLSKLLTWLHGFENHIDFQAANAFKGGLVVKGTPQHDEWYLLYLLNQVGYDLVLLSESDKILSVPPFIQVNHFTQRNTSHTIAPQPAVPSQDYKTVQLQAQDEITQDLYTSTGLFRSYQTDGYEVHTLTLKSTLDELLIYWAEDARFRPGFESKEHAIYVPRLFCKINGTDDKLDAYAQRVYPLLTHKQTLVYTQIPLLHIRTKKADHQEILALLANLSPDRIKRSPLYRYAHIKDHVQTRIISSILHILALPVFDTHPDYRKDHALYCLLMIPDEILNLLQLQDYPQVIPKIVIFDSDKDLFSKWDHYLLHFIYLQPFDVLFLSPQGYENIEHVLGNDVCQEHHLKHLPKALRFKDVFDKGQQIHRRNNRFSFFRKRQ